MANIYRESKVLINGLCLACKKTFTMEELRDEENVYVVMENSKNKGIYHSRCHKLESGMITLKSYLEMVGVKKRADIEIFLNKFLKEFGKAYSEQSAKSFNPSELEAKSLVSLAMKWLEGCDLRQLKVEDILSLIMFDLRENARSGRKEEDFNKHYSLQNHLVDRHFQNLKDKVEEKRSMDDYVPCCERIKEGLRDILSIVTFFNLKSPDKKELSNDDDILAIVNVWKTLKDKCNHCLKIEKQTLDILTNEE